MGIMECISSMGSPPEKISGYAPGSILISVQTCLVHNSAFKF